MRVPVESLRKGLSVLEVLCQSRTPCSLSDVAQRMGWKRTSTHNLLKTLVLCGYAENLGEGRYAPGWRLGDLGRQLWWRDHGAGNAVLRSVVAEVAADVGESVVLAVLVSGRRRVLARADGNQVIRVDTDAMELDGRSIWSVVTGRLLAAYCSPGELSLIMERDSIPPGEWPDVCGAGDPRDALARIRERGVATHEAGEVASLAVPVMQADHGCIAALGTYLPMFRYDARRREALIAGLRRGADRLAPILIDAFGGDGCPKRLR